MDGKLRVSSKEVYELYSASAKMRPLSKKQLGTLVMNLYPTIKVVKNREGCHEYEGLNHNSTQDRTCNVNEIDEIARECQYFNIPTLTDSCKYGVMTGHFVNKIQIMKIVEIKPDRTFTVYIGGRGIKHTDIGLTNIDANTYLSVKMIFNTVKQARLCKGKPVENKINVTKSRYVHIYPPLSLSLSLSLSHTHTHTNTHKPKK